MKTVENKGFLANNKTEYEVDFFKDKVEKLEDENQLLNSENQVLKHTIEEQEAKLKYYEEQLRLNAEKKYSPSSEKNPDQLSLFNEAEIESVKNQMEIDLEKITYNRRKGKTKSRKTYDDLPIVEVKYVLDDDELDCPTCGGKLHEMKVETRKELVIVPAEVKVKHIHRQYYACRTCDNKGTTGTIVAAPVPNAVLPKSLVSPSLLAFIMDKKYREAMPLYRQEKGFENLGIDIPRQNMGSWIIKGAEIWLKPLFERMNYYLLQEDIIHADETTLQVIDEKDNKKNYMWYYGSSKSSDKHISIFDYQKSRSANHPKKFLGNYNGYLQTDGYAGYNKLKVKHLACMAHARRKFDEALKAAPKDADISKTKSKKALKYFSNIYKYEKVFKADNLDFNEIYAKRLEFTKPILEEFHEWLLAESKKTLPKSLLGKAITYSLKQWDKLIVFLEDGRLLPDNNHAERAIKNFVIGRKNWLFSKSSKGATASGIIYSIVETAKANNLNVFKYLTYLFEELPNIDLEDFNQLDALLPWKETIPNEILLMPKNSK
ncbi:MAG: IS66 family transposase [Marinisporobacter sp.]|nr:IS66 family transposase [Marinisporobacter sp.]